jgi:hypothetical protein
MEKTIFLFRRKESRTPADFARHYIGNHAPLGARLTRCLLGYTVNIVESPRGVDALTEHWVPSAMDLLTLEKAYATPEDAEAVWADDGTLFSSFDLYVVVEEADVVPAEPLDSPMGQASPETKLVWFYPDAKAAPSPPTAARRVVDNRVGFRLVRTEQEWTAVKPDIELIRMAWSEDFEGLRSDAARAFVVKEYRFIPAPTWEAGST